MKYQTVAEVYRKITQRIENLSKGMRDENQVIINELNWVRAELEMTNEVNPN